MQEKESYNAKGISLTSDIFFENSKGEHLWKCILNPILKLHDDPMVNKSQIIVLPGEIWVYVGKTKSYTRGTFPLSQTLFHKSQR